MKILNLFAGVGGNRKFWNGHVTAVEHDQAIADVYARLYPDDKVVVGDAHAYLLEHAQEFDFIWTSPPCQSHSKFTRTGRNRSPRYADMSLYQEVLFLQADFDGLWVVENVNPYYKPLIPAQLVGRHLFWSNFPIGKVWEPPPPPGGLMAKSSESRPALMDWLGIHFDELLYVDGNHCPSQVLRNCVHPEIGRQIMEAGIMSLGLFPEGD